jgi:predicted Zn-dependent protease
LLGGIAGNILTGDERRLQRLLQADLWLARGKIEAARNQYLAAGGRLDRKTADATAAARLESASILIEHDQFDDAQEALDRLAFEIPIERMALEVGLLKIKLALAHKEFQRAFTGCRLLAPVAENEPRQSELLYDTIESGLALGKKDDARRSLTQLLKSFPYSESAAKAKAQWPQQ